MNLRTKTFFIITAIFISAFLIMAVLLRTFIMNGYLREEAQITSNKVTQAQSTLEDTLSNLESLVTDWAEWDDTYQFIVDKNKAYIESNLLESTLFNNRFNLVAYLNTKNDIIYIKTYDLVNGETVPAPESLMSYLISSSPLLSPSKLESGYRGIISQPNAPMLIVSHPILTSQGDGPARGTLIFGRYLDSTELSRISRVTHLTIKGYQPDEALLPEDFKKALPDLLKGMLYVVQPLDENTISGYTLLKDINGQPAFIIRVDNSRVLYAQANNDIFYFTLALLAFGLIFILVILVILERLVISRISNLSLKVNIIGEKGNLSSRISLPGKDEISSLASNINGMLDNLEQSKKLHKESETFNQTLLQDSPNPIEVINPDGSLRYVNPALEIITGYSRKQLIGRRPPFPWWASENMPQYLAELSMIASKGSQTSERCFQKPNGESFWVEITFSAVKQGGETIFIIANWVDITKRKKADDAIRESEKRFRELAELLPELVFEIDPDGKLTFVNRIAFSVFGYLPEDYNRLNLVDLFVPENRELANQNLLKIIKGEELGNTEYTAVRKNGNLFPVFLHATSIKNNRGEVIGVRGILVDITAQKKTREELEKLYRLEKSAREELQIEIRSRIEFTRALVHELKTPLTPIMASSELLVEELTQEPLLGLAKNVYRGAENMNRRVDELLDLARGEVGILKVNLRPVDPEKLLREVAKYMAPSAEHNGQSLSLNLPEKLPVIIADDDRVRQILLNLISNSIKYSPTGGKITISTRKEDNQLVIEIQDTGRGMSGEEQEKLFQPYYRIEGRDHLSGLGLGLALSKRLIELQNGRIWVVSQKGKGSTFAFSLPIKR